MSRYETRKTGAKGKAETLRRRQVRALKTGAAR